MHSKSRTKFYLLNKKTLSAAVLSTLLCSSAYAAGLGKLTVLSSLGQPLRAEIELNSVSKDEAGNIVAKLASADSYQQANIDFNPILYSLRFGIESRGDRQILRVTSAQPINEPFVDMLIELTGNGNRLLREYTFLLDPVDLRTTQSTQVAATPGTASSSSSSNNSSSSSSASVAPSSSAMSDSSAGEASAPKSSRRSGMKAPKAAPAAAPVRAAAAAPSGDSYTVKKGDTLAAIASQVKPEGVSLDQMLVALYRANPNAFIGNNMNRLRAGQILSVPDADAARSTGISAAHGVVIAQAADFNNYRNKLAGQVESAVPQKSVETKQAATGKITAKVEEKPTAANEAKDKLKLSKAAGPSASASAGKGTGMTAGMEDKLAKDKALSDANSRIKELEKNVSDLQQILVVKNKALEEQQKQAEASKKAVAPASAPAPAQPAPAASAPASMSASAPAASASATASAPAASAAASAPAAPAASAPAASMAASTPAAKPPVAAVKPPVRKPVAPPPPPPSLMDDLLGSTGLLAGLGVIVLAGIGGVAYKLSRKKKQPEKFDDSLMDESSLRANSLFGSTGGQSVDTNNSVFNSSFTASSSQLDTNEVDPVAEADVYIAYGRDAQAEEILKEALRTQPDRNAVRLKLLEIYASRKDLRAFETLATELYSLTKGEGEDWAQAVAMGVALDPSNPLYGGKAEEGSGSGTLAAPTQPLDDEHELDALLETTQEKLSADDTLGNDANYFGSTLMEAAPDTAAPEAMPELNMEAEAAPVVPSLSSSALDFDLDGLNKASAPSVAEVKPAEEAPLDLDIGMLDFGSATADAAPAVSEEEAIAPATAMSVDVGSDDLAFMPSIGTEPAAAEAPAVDLQVSDTSANSLNFDLSDISLDLDPTAMESQPTAPHAESGGDALADFALPDSLEPALTAEPEAEYTADSEMATKLDLAIAYQEIGDKEGARELLDEVIKGGSPDQSEKAKSLLVSMA